MIFAKIKKINIRMILAFIGKDDRAQPLDQDQHHMSHPSFSYIQGVESKRLFSINASKSYV